MAEARKRYDKETIEQARALWSEGVPVADICQQLGINNARVVYTWRDRYEWDTPNPIHLVQVQLSQRMILLVDLESKSPQHYEELSRLGDELLKLDKAKTYQQGEKVSAGRPAGVKNGEGKRNKRKKKIKNDISNITVEQLREIEETYFYDHQKIWLEAGRNPKTKRNRFILKPRQVGATHTFAFEAFCDAIEHGHNQMFISSTRSQAEVFRSYLISIAWDFFEIELTGNPIVLSNGAEFHFLSPNSNAQSRSGNVYFDECFWTGKFEQMRKLAAPMATLTDFKKTYFSTPSAISHDAYELWSGEHYFRHNPDVEINVDDIKPLKYGRLDADGIWRCAFTVEDAVEMGWDRVNLEELRLETPDPAVYSNIYQCRFVDDSASVFKLKELLACAVDPEKAWKRVNYKTVPCTSGYDPAGTGDNASFVIMTKPSHFGEKFRLIRKHSWQDMSPPAQTQAIANLCTEFSIKYLEIDATGPGNFVAGFIDTSYIREVSKVQYSPEYKTQMIQKGKSVIGAQRFEYDENDKDLPLSFMTIYQTVTESDAKITYKSRRSKKVGHGDDAWACLHGFMCEPLAVERKRTARARSIH